MAWSTLPHRGQISIHALREEGDKHHDSSGTDLGYFYPRPPRGGRLYLDFRCFCFFSISIHALREEGDMMFSILVSSRYISIHALREEGDLRTAGHRT